jgi:uncharacterized protein (DUF362 family)
MAENINRRTFIKSTAATGASFALFRSALSDSEPPGGEETGKSRVVQVASPGVVKEGRRLDNPHVRKMVERGILELTGKKDLAAAWKCFVKPDDVVGIKLNSGDGKRFISTKKPILEVVIDGVQAAGVPANKIIVWDQVEESLHGRYCRIQKMKRVEGGVQYRGCTPTLRKENYMEGKPLDGFETEPVKFSWGQVKVAELVANELTAIINLPVLKDHACSGVTLSMKNISHAVVDQPWHCHDDSCDPYIADIVNIPVVRDKLRLHILDGIFGVAEGGPPLMSMNHLFNEEKILLSTDPVAVDTIGCTWVVEARKKKGYPPLEEAENKIPGFKGRPPKHIATAAARGLGTNDVKKIELVKVDLPVEPVEKEKGKAG